MGRQVKNNSKFTLTMTACAANGYEGYYPTNECFELGGYEVFNASYKRGENMNTKNAVAERIIELCNQKNIAINALANVSGISPSTLYSVLNEKSQNPGIVTIKKLCDGLDISLREFFDDDIFDDIEQEIK